MYLLPSGFILIGIIILLLIRFSYFTITKPQTSGFGTNLKSKAKKYKSVLPHRLALDARGANQNTSRSMRIVRDKDSMGKEIFFAKSGSRSEDKEGASASRKLDSTLPRLEGDIQDGGTVGGPNLNLIELQRDLVILTSKYELLQHDACHSREGHQKLERERGVWILEKACMKEEFKVLKSSEIRFQGLHGDVATQDRVFPHYVPNSSIKHSKNDSKDRSQEIL
jgi:hypothetical protein